MAEKEIKWTPQQLKAIKARDNNVLVTASAGTGKTAVLSGRCLSIISENQDIRNMLILTFTEAAAEQMRSRIAELLKEAVKNKPNSHIRYQLILMQNAEISTIHSFCKRLITENFYKIGLDPTFRVIDEDQQKLLKLEALEATIEKAWQRNDLRDALEQLLYGRNLQIGDGFLSVIVNLSNFLDGVVSRQVWFERAEQFTNIINQFSTRLGEKQKQIAAERLSDISAMLGHAQELYESFDTGGDWSSKWKRMLAEPVLEYIKMLESGDWEGFCERLKNHQAPARYGYKPKNIPDLPTDIIAGISKKAKELFENLFEIAVLNPQYTDSVGSIAGLQTKVLIELVRIFEQFYSQAKQSINCLDFADLEHYTLKLLTEDSSADNPVPSQTALALRNRFQHISVDEYQDINSVQRLLIQMLSAGNNVFNVGDVKQSIYAFRGSQPKIFLDQLNAVSPQQEGTAAGLRIELNTNFRSAKGILDFTNKIFSRIMTASFGQLNYDDSVMLKPPDSEKSPIEANNSPVVELHILDQTDKNQDSEDEQAEETTLGNNRNSGLDTSRRCQAAMIAERIRQITGADTGKAEFQIFDKTQNVLRDVQYKDIVILMRSLVGKANYYVEVLRLAGVPVSCKAAEGYFQTTEITDCLSLLKVLDNPQRDIETAAVLRSPLFKVSDTELLKIKIYARQKQQGSFYTHLLDYCDRGPDLQLAEKLKKVLSRLEQWRSAGRSGEIADLIWRIYRETGYMSYVSALLNGRSRKANLLQLHERAIQFEGFAGGSGNASLNRFVDFLEDIQEAGQDWAPAEPQNSAGNAVRILSVHKSKGLEFPVVFLAELQGNFNTTDVRADCLISDEDALGLRIIDRKTNSKISSLAHQVIAEQKISSSLEEEMRILYVATTRARDRLILTASQKQERCRQFISNGYYFGDSPIPHWQLKDCKNPLEWILYALSDQTLLHQALGTGLADRADEKLFTFRLYNNTDMGRFSNLLTEQKNRKPGTSGNSLTQNTMAGGSDSALLAKVKKSLSWTYQFSEVSVLPAKQSVSELTHRDDEYVRFDYSMSLSRLPRVVSSDVAKSKTVEQRIIGSATHLVISRLDLSVPVTAETISRTVEKLTAEKSFSTDVADAVQVNSILDFFNNETGQLALDDKNIVYREWPFTFALPTSELSNSSDDFIVVQGIIDMLIRTPDGLVVLDFKTDNINAAQVSHRAELYRRQLALYGRAASAILKTECISKWLYFLIPAVAFSV